MAVRKIVILNPKGGSGKTTIATNLAAYYASEGLAPALMDYDSQGSSTRWLSKRPAECPYIHGIATYENHAGQTRSFALRVPPEIERVVVDTPAAFQKHELVDFTRGADKIIIPVLPSDIDIHAATRTIADLLLTAKVSRHEDRLAVVANRVKRNTIMFRSLMRFLESLEIPVAAVLRDTQNYIKTSEAGKGLHEQQRSQVENDLVQWKRLVAWLESDPEPNVLETNVISQNTNRAGLAHPRLLQ